MDTIEKLSGQLLGLWLAITGIAIAFGVLYAVAAALRRRCSPQHSETRAIAPLATTVSSALGR